MARFNLCGDICNFENFHGRRLVKNNRKIGLMPLLTAGENNNGVSDFISNNKMRKFKNVITIDMFGNSFFHDYYCLGDDNIYFFTNDKLSKFIKLFIVNLINKNKNKFSYGKQFRQKNADKLKILLPINEKNQPDWQFMEEYAKSIFDKKQQMYKTYMVSPIEKSLSELENDVVTVAREVDGKS